MSIQAYLPRTAAHDAALASVRLALRQRYQVATTVGYGPSNLHSTGQYHKGGRNNGLFIQVMPDGDFDLAIPGRGYTFGELTRAQALGDVRSLQRRNRPVAQVMLSELEATVGGIR